MSNATASVLSKSDNHNVAKVGDWEPVVYDDDESAETMLRDGVVASWRLTTAQPCVFVDVLSNGRFQPVLWGHYEDADRGAFETYATFKTACEVAELESRFVDEQAILWKNASEDDRNFHKRHMAVAATGVCGKHRVMLWLVISDASPEGRFSISDDAWAKRCGWKTARTLRKHVQELVELGHLKHENTNTPDACPVYQSPIFADGIVVPKLDE